MNRRRLIIFTSKIKQIILRNIITSLKHKKYVKKISFFILVLTKKKSFIKKNFFTTAHKQNDFIVKYLKKITYNQNINK